VDTGSDDGNPAIVPPHAGYRDGGVQVSVPRDSAGARRVAAGSADGKVTVRTANRPARVFVRTGWENGTPSGPQHGRGM